MTKVPVEITARHIHLAKKECDILFGKNRQLTVLKNISQPGQFAAKETINVIGPKGELKGVRIVAPLRDKSQLEITATDARNLGIEAPYHVSGEFKDAARVTLVGPKGKAVSPCAIIAFRHLHLSTAEGKKMGLKKNQMVSVIVGQERKLTFHNVIVRCGERHKLSVHLDTDEANAAGLKSCGYGQLIRKK